MPNHLANPRFNDVQYVSIIDYMRRIDELDNIDDKMAFTTNYLLSYGTEQRDIPLAEAIHVAKIKIAEASARIRAKEIMIPDEAVDPHLSDEEDAPNRLFMIDPARYLLNQANDYLTQEIENGNGQIRSKRFEDYQLMSAHLMNGINGSLSAEISELDILPTSRDVDARIKAKYTSAREFNKQYKATKPGFLSKLFATPSRAYNNLESVYEAFHNPNHVLYGDMNALDKAATEYLKHCFPTWNPKLGGISGGAIRSLSDPKKSRAMLSLNILKATAEQRLTEGVYERMIAANIQNRADLEAAAGDEVLENEANKEFQKDIQNELKNEDNLDSSQAERDYAENFKDIPDPEEEPAIE